MYKSKSLAFVILVWSLQEIQASVRFTNLVCNIVDENFASSPYCYIKSVNRTHQYVSLKVGLLKVPVTNVTVKLSLLKRANGYKPFLYDFAFDACYFLRHQKNPLFKHFYAIIPEFSNMNHTCPFDHDIIIEKLPSYHIDNLFTKKLPLPRGDYALFTKWEAYNVLRAVVNIYVTMG